MTLHTNIYIYINVGNKIINKTSKYSILIVKKSGDEKWLGISRRELDIAKFDLRQQGMCVRTVQIERERSRELVRHIEGQFL